MISFRIKSAPCLFLLILLFSINSYASDISLLDAMNTRFERSSITIKQQGGQMLSFSVELAKTPRQLQVGLMHRQSLDDKHGMLFIYPGSVPNMSFWMKNTYIALDMVFISTDGRINHIHKGAKPLDLTPVTSPYQTLGVLELAAGDVTQYNIQEGDFIIHSAFGNN